jgi:hypothetical protein
MPSKREFEKSARDDLLFGKISFAFERNGSK